MAKSSGRGPAQFIQEVKLEGAKVTWPTAKETRITTVVVFLMVTFVALFLFFGDWLISLGIQFVLGVGS
ncbi:MAG: preprotein translocase subunit SecE [Alphaproteobacteria bacterium]|nr:MAG: preprotein translocase subunit SecE [Alphaproteobacteria bacterium]